MGISRKFNGWFLSVGRICLIVAVLAAPIATSLQMLSVSRAAASVQSDGMPCHGTQHADDRAAPTSGSCTCSPWCHAAVTAAFEFDFTGNARKMVIPVAPPMTEKTANVARRFKPPIA